MKSAVTIIAVILLVFACTHSDTPDLIGKWDDNIQLSEKYVEFSAHADSISINTKCEWWWINELTLNDTTHIMIGDNIDLESASYKIESEDYMVARKDKTTLFVKFNDNNTGKDRTLTVTLEAGDYFDYVTVVQLAE